MFSQVKKNLIQVSQVYNHPSIVKDFEKQMLLVIFK